MLKSRSLIILVIVLVALGAISLIQSLSHRKATSRSNTSPVLTGDFTTEDLSRIEIGYGPDKDVVVLEKLPDNWVVRSAYSHRANQSRVDNLLRDLSDLQGEFRSDSPQVLVDYGFTDSTSISIVGYVAGKTNPLFSVEVGKKPTRSVGNFVKVPGSSAVYLTSKGILGSLGLYGDPEKPQNKHFFELEAHKCERLDVDAITLYDGDSVVALVKEFEEPEPAADDTTGVVPEIDRKIYEWKLTEPVAKTALKTKGDGVLGSIVNVRAVDVADPDAEPSHYGLDNPQKRVKIRMQDGTETVIIIGNMQDASEGNQAGYYLQVGNDKTVWVVSEYLIKNIFKGYEELLPEEE